MKVFLEKIRTAQRVLITTHQLPDGDGVGSEMALAAALEKLGKRVHLLNTHATPTKFSFVDRETQIQVYEPGSVVPLADLVIVVDTHDWKMLGPLKEPLQKMGAPVCFLDHHVPDGPMTENHIIDETCRATGEMVFHLIKKMGIEIDAKIATSLYMALLTDVKTLGFVGTNSAFHRVMAELLDCGADTQKVFLDVYSDDSVNKVKLFGHVLKEMKTSSNGKLAWLEISRTLRESYQATVEDTEGYIDRLTLIKGLRVAILFREETDGKIKVSLRGLQGQAVLPIAARFGGGGHQFAAGMRVPGELAQVVSAVCQATEAQLAL